MTDPRLTAWLGHMLRAATDARDFVEGMTREDFLADRRTQQAVVMSLVVIGEAAARIMDADPGFAAGHPEVPWQAMRGMRNRMAHGYFETDFGIVWSTVDTEIPGLREQLTLLLRDIGHRGADPAPSQFRT
jgi:uncharacterized protein with HEPN domain